MTTNSETDTPRTDALLTHNHDGDFVLAVEQLADFARQLERELNEANAKLAATMEDKANQGLALVTLCDMVLGEDNPNRSDADLIRGVRGLINDVDNHQPELCAEVKMERDALKAECEELRQNTNDMSMLIRRLCRQICKHDAGNGVRRQAIEYLDRKGFTGSPLKSDAAMKGQQ